LEHLGVLAGARVLDLYAGSGALGLEALSRGAQALLLVESDQAAAKVAESNVRAVGLPGAVLRRGPVARVLATPPTAPYGLVFSDPPYALPEEDLAGDFALLVEQGWLTEDALVVVERSSRSPEPRWPVEWECEGERRYGETRIWFAGPRVPEEPA
jgi:16S rRNA (guanine966-N2)-methyltransferase